MHSFVYGVTGRLNQSKRIDFRFSTRKSSMKRLPSFTDRLHQLIALPSISSANPSLDMSNQAVVAILADWFEQLGFAIQVQDIPGTPGKQNLIARRGSGPGGLILSGHTDTVPYDDSGWDSDPFKVADSDQAFYGLGTSDMKGFFSVVIDAIQQLEGKDLRKPLTIVATADEESSMAGARALERAGIEKASAAIIGEPTDLKPIRMHKGIMMQSIRIQGQSGHSSNPALGRSALEAMQDVLGALRAFRASMQEQHQNPGFEIAYPTLNLGCIHGGDNPNRICSHCELEFDLRPLPGMSITALREDIDRLIFPIADAHSIDINHKELFAGVEAFEQVENSELVTTAKGLTGHDSESVAFATEAPFYKAMDIPTLVLGPGSIDQAHQPNEYLPQNQIQPGAELYRKLIEHYCL